MKGQAIVLWSALSVLLVGGQVRAQEEKDPYLWLEDVEGEKALEWVGQHNEVSLGILKAQPAFEVTFDKTLEILNSDQRIASPQFRGGYIYNFWQDEQNERGLWRRTTLADYLAGSPQWETLLDIDKLSEVESQQWVFKGATGLYPDYQRYLISLSPGGGDAVVVREFDAETRTFVEGGFYLPEAKSTVSWKDIDTVYVATDFGQGSLTDSGYPRIAKRWRRGTPLSEAETVFEGQAADVAVDCSTINRPERQYDIVYRLITFYTSHAFVIEDGKLIRLEIPDDADFGGFFKNQMLVRLKSDWVTDSGTYKQGSLIGIDYDSYLQGSRAFTVIVEPDERSSIASYSNTRDLLLVNMLDNVRSELYEYRFNNGAWTSRRVDTPRFGNLSVTTTDARSDRYFFTYEDFLTPRSLYYVSPGQAMKTVDSLPAFFDSNDLEAEQFEAVSKDGTRVPYFVVRPKAMKADGSNPTLLYGYGGFEISLQPGYNAVTGAAWLSKGGVYVLANIRGGGEFGPAWHQAALKENRQRAYDDFIAVAEDLIARKITSPEHLGIMGGSNGGLLMGVMFTQRPDLFKGVVCAVPLLDMKRYSHLLAGASWMAEYGDPDVPEQWAYIGRYSPYQNLSAGTDYPDVFFYTSTRDDRVHPGHARKMVARMEALGSKVYYYENTEGGHAAASTNRQRALTSALTYAYLWMQLR